MTDTKTTKKQYNKFAEEYHQHISRPDNSWHRFIEKPAMTALLKDIIKNKKVLDLGCGSGEYTKKLHTLKAKITGLDLSKNLIAIAKKEHPNMTFRTGDAKKTPFKKSEFNVVTSSLMVHYFKDLRPLYKEVSRILKTKGYFVFSMHHPIMEVSGRLKQKIKGVKKASLLYPYFHNEKYKWKLMNKMKLIAYHHTFENIANALKNSGFIVERIIEPTAPKRSEKINKNIYERSNRRPSFLLIRARKIK